MIDINRPLENVGIGGPPSIDREDVDQEKVRDSIDRAVGRGDIAQQLRLKFYPSIEIDFSKLYAGSLDIELGVSGVEDRLYDMGFRNNPTAYVEITERFGPDDSSYGKQVVTDNQEFPHLGFGRPFGVITWWNRTKNQFHAAIFVDEDRELIHICCHHEASAWLQPARHVRVSDPSARIGVRDFRDFWFDEFGEELPRPLE